jgi:hypothetical protein
MKTIHHSIRVGFVVLALLVPTIYAAPAAPAQSADDGMDPGADGYVFAHVAQETMPDKLMSAFLAASSQPFEAGAAGYRAHSGGLNFVLNAGGLQAEGNGLSLNFALSGMGHGEQIVALPEPAIVQTDSRLEYRRGALTEWYRDIALGLEQGFTIHEPPAGDGMLTLRLDLDTGLQGALDANGRGLSFAASDGRTLRYDHLRAWDARGVPLEATLHYTPGQVTIQVRDRGAAYPITIDPLIYLEQKIAASDGAAHDHFGASVALDGDMALVGAPNDDVGANEDQGSVYVLTRIGTTWGQRDKLTASDGTTIAKSIKPPG